MLPLNLPWRGQMPSAATAMVSVWTAEQSRNAAGYWHGMDMKWTYGACRHRVGARGWNGHHTPLGPGRHLVAQRQEVGGTGRTPELYGSAAWNLAGPTPRCSRCDLTARSTSGPRSVDAVTWRLPTLIPPAVSREEFRKDVLRVAPECWSLARSADYASGGITTCPA